MTLEQRVRRAERMLVIMANSGRRTRSEWGYKINGLIDAQMRFEATVHESQKRNEVESREQKERIDKLIQSQMETSQQIKSVQRETSEQIKGLAAAQAKTDEALRAFINSLRKGNNGSSSRG